MPLNHGSKITSILVLATAFSTFHVFAGGPALREIGTPGSIGTAGALHPVNIFDSSAAFTNPAGLSFIKGDQFRVGGQYLITDMSFSASDGTTANGSSGGDYGEDAPIPGFYASGHFNEQWAWGVGLSGAFGGGLDYGDDFVGRYQANKSVLSAAGLTGSVSYRVNEKLSIGLGISAVYTSLELEISVPGAPNPAMWDPSTDGEIRIDEIDDVAEQWHIGMIYEINEQWLIGAVYHSEVESTLEGDIIFKNVNVPVNSQFQSDVSADLTFADILDLGVIYSPTDNLKFIFEADYENWDDLETIGLSSSNEDLTLQNIPFNFKDTWRVGFATMYHYDVEYLFAAGFSYDSSVVDDKDRRFDLPLDEQTRFSLAWGKHVPGDYDWSFSVSYIDMGDAKIDQLIFGPDVPSQRVVGEFSSNDMIAIAFSYSSTY